VRAARAGPGEAQLDLGLDIAGAVVAAGGVEAEEGGDPGARPAQCPGIAAQRAERRVAHDELQIPVEDRDPEAQRLDGGAQQGRRLIRDGRVCRILCAIAPRHGQSSVPLERGERLGVPRGVRRTPRAGKELADAIR